MKHFLEPREQKLGRKMHKKRPQLLMAGTLILHDNAHLHIADVVTKKLPDYGWEVLPLALYSPDISPPDFDLFPKLKGPMRRFFLSGRAFYRQYPSYSTHEWMWCLGWNNNASQTLGLCHREQGDYIEDVCVCVCVFQCQPTALLRASGSMQGG